MSFLQAIVLGIVQGATEFIPVSSSGHLVLVPWLLGWSSPGLTFDTILHWGTLLAVVGYFRRDLAALVRAGLHGLVTRHPFATLEARLAWLLVVATLPAALAGLALERQFEALFNAPIFVAAFLLLTGLLLWASEGFGSRLRDLASVNAPDALTLGIAQALAIAPGISRSGSTIAAGLLRGLDRPAAARFSFLMMVPIVFGAGLCQLVELAETGLAPGQPALLLVGFVAAAVTGYACIAFLLDYLRRHSLRVFAFWCWGLGLFSLAVALLRDRF